MSKPTRSELLDSWISIRHMAKENSEYYITLANKTFNDLFGKSQAPDIFSSLRNFENDTLKSIVYPILDSCHQNARFCAVVYDTAATEIVNLGFYGINLDLPKYSKIIGAPKILSYEMSSFNEVKLQRFKRDLILISQLKNYNKDLVIAVTNFFYYDDEYKSIAKKAFTSESDLYMFIYDAIRDSQSKPKIKLNVIIELINNYLNYIYISDNSKTANDRILINILLYANDEQIKYLAQKFVKICTKTIIFGTNKQIILREE